VLNSRSHLLERRHDSFNTCILSTDEIIDVCLGTKIVGFQLDLFCLDGNTYHKRGIRDSSRIALIDSIVMNTDSSDPAESGFWFARTCNSVGSRHDDSVTYNKRDRRAKEWALAAQIVHQESFKLDYRSDRALCAYFHVSIATCMTSKVSTFQSDKCIKPYYYRTNKPLIDLHVQIKPNHSLNERYRRESFHFLIPLVVASHQ
jgi:hypothetical protein